MRERIKWIDVAKFFGIFAIYVGHFGPFAGNGYNFVFAFHVPLFFFISGCTETLSSEQRLGRSLLKKVKTILLPFFVFVIMSAMMDALSYSQDQLPLLLLNLKDGIVFGAIRNRFIAGQLWFLSCYFVVAVLFRLLRTFLNQYVILALSTVAYIILGLNGVSANPQMIYNVDSAMFYFFYYALGYATFPMIRWLFRLDSVAKKVTFTLTGAGALVYAVLLYFLKDPFWFLINYRMGFIAVVFLEAVIMIWLIFVLSRLLENVEPLQEIGRATLYLCGSEYLIKGVLASAAGIVGLSVNVNGLLQVCIYSAILLAVGTKFVAPWEKRAFTAMQDGIDKLLRIST